MQFFEIFKKCSGDDKVEVPTRTGGKESVKPREVSNRLNELLTKATATPLSTDEAAELRGLLFKAAEILLVIVRDPEYKDMAARIGLSSDPDSVSRVENTATAIKLNNLAEDPDAAARERKKIAEETMRRDFAGKIGSPKLFFYEDALRDAQKKKENGKDPVYIACLISSETGEATYGLMRLNAAGDGFEPFSPKEELRALSDAQINKISDSNLQGMILALKLEAQEQDQADDSVALQSAQRGYSPDVLLYLLRLHGETDPAAIIGDSPPTDDDPERRVPV
ncbi:MAG: hypothetical protein LBF24_00125 [Puniceicoccales bacterium]|jgi:hypothetical protein|nr:hypothetical protein [Puniceicoccales bacterium]